ncbi:MAG: hypothetical protein WAJ99_03910 [Candidatus Sulfotelmatobacter sp.]
MNDEAREDGTSEPESGAGQIASGHAAQSGQSADTTAASGLMALPGLAAIALYLLVLAGVIILGVVTRHYPVLFLFFAAAFITSSAGLVLLLRWAWSLALAAVLLLACYNLWIFSVSHGAPGLVQGLLNLVLFLYMIRTEVRVRLR